MSDARRLVAVIVAVIGLGIAVFGVVRGISKTGPAQGVRMTVALEPPVDADALAIAKHVVTDRIDEKGVETRVMPAGDKLVVEIGDTDPELIAQLVEVLERVGTLEIHAVDAVHPWLARTRVLAGNSALREEGGILVADDQHLKLPVAEAEALGCTGGAADTDGSRSCSVHGHVFLAKALASLLPEVPPDRIVAYGRIGEGKTWRPYVLEPTVLLEGRAIRRAEYALDGVAIDATDTSRIERNAVLAFVFEGKVKQVRTVERVTPTSVHVRTAPTTEGTREALDLVSVIHAGAVRPLKIMRQDAFTRTTGFLPRAWLFLVIGGLLLGAGALLWFRN
jgi:hypothetical protein